MSFDGVSERAKGLGGEENGLGFKEFGEMMQRTWREKSDWASRMVVKFGVVEFERSAEELRKERDELIGTRRIWEVKVGDRGEEIGG